MAQDTEGQRHREGWESFTRLLTRSTVAIVILLALMALFLV
ncbi:MAG: aa3-type cytochrome c oxidase subunit IV [Acetobacterales bacterium]